ncbi:TIGR03862 family flavoprotein [Aquabacterium sp. A7-Y]|uniref:NAD(P)/FAD-dependent oxidoreductase n=1 Tax=Aquabacterium sp. A7-Y TaxID=1349605 RepID=UPI00223DFECD|nr:TIGR03862 family flavoprotein [Aquabacterium sp. A7-Y]MCW7538349.1 TIGR03862 family flavoprotein [Aquabacterium sp. A7-Y]
MSSLLSSDVPSSSVPAVIVGGGPAGLMAAETLAAAGCRVELYDAMPSVGRKFLLAGKGGLNLTHSEPIEPFFLSRYGERREQVAPWLARFSPQALREWAQGLGVSTFVGSSGRVFPAEMKAAPLLRSWLHRLREAGVRFHMRHRWQGWGEDGSLRFASPAGEQRVQAGAVVLALGGASWPRLGSDGAWVPLLEARAVQVARLRPSNCGFDVAARGPGGCGWSEHFQSRFAGEPLKSVVLTHAGTDGQSFSRQGEFVVTGTGIEGSLVYAASARLRDEIERHGSATLELDLMPGWDPARVLSEVAHPRGARSLSSHLQSRLHLKGVKMGLLRELLDAEAFADPARLARAIKGLPLRLVAPRPIEEAISTAGGVRLEALDEQLMLKALPGVFCAGEMLDWEAPTGGYLLSACFASGRVAGAAAAAWQQGGSRAG